MSEPARMAPDHPRVLWFYGADAVGKSTVGWEAYTLLVDRGTSVAYVDTDYLSFCHPAPDDPAAVVAENLAAVWCVYAARGIDHLVVSGIVVTAGDRDRFDASIPSAGFTYCRLTASDETVRRRIIARREAEAATRGSTVDAELREELVAYGDRSVDFAALLERVALEDFTLSTDARTPREIADEAIRRLMDRRSRSVAASSTQDDVAQHDVGRSLSSSPAGPADAG